MSCFFLLMPHRRTAISINHVNLEGQFTILFLVEDGRQFQSKHHTLPHIVVLQQCCNLCRRDKPWRIHQDRRGVSSRFIAVMISSAAFFWFAFNDSYNRDLSLSYWRWSIGRSWTDGRCSTGGQQLLGISAKRQHPISQEMVSSSFITCISNRHRKLFQQFMNNNNLTVTEQTCKKTLQHRWRLKHCGLLKTDESMCYHRRNQKLSLLLKSFHTPSVTRSRCEILLFVFNSGMRRL